MSSSIIDHSSLSTTVGRVAAALSRDLHPGDVAALRRSAPDEWPPAFWRIALGYLEPAGAFAGRLDGGIVAERRWAIILRAMAELEGLHKPGARLGRVLGETMYSDLRFLRLLRAREDVLPDALRGAIHFIASKALPVDQTDIARLVLSSDRPDEESVRRSLARDYYRASS